MGVLTAQPPTFMQYSLISILVFGECVMIPVDQSTSVWDEMGSGLGAALDQATTFPVN